MRRLALVTALGSLVITGFSGFSGSAGADPRVGANLQDGKTGIYVAVVGDPTTGSGIVDFQLQARRIYPCATRLTYERLTLASGQFTVTSDASGPAGAHLRVPNLVDPCGSGSTGALDITWVRTAQSSAAEQPAGARVIGTAHGSYLGRDFDTATDGAPADMVDFSQPAATLGDALTGTPLGPDRGTPGTAPSPSYQGGQPSPSGAVAGTRRELPFTAAPLYTRGAMANTPVNFYDGRLTTRVAFAEESGGDPTTGAGFGPAVGTIYDDFETCVGPAVAQEGPTVATACDPDSLMHIDYLNGAFPAGTVDFGIDGSGSMRLPLAAGQVDLSWTPLTTQGCADPDVNNAPPAYVLGSPPAASGQDGISRCTVTQGAVLGAAFSPAQSSWYRLEAQYAVP